MIRTLSSVLKQDREKFTVPRKVQDIIPVRTIWSDGVFLSGKNKYSKMYRFTDINYAVASRADKEGMFIQYSELLNSLDPGCTAKITINNRRINRFDFEKQILLPMKEDGLDIYRKEYNDMLMDRATGANSIVQDKYITISVNRRSIEDARIYFARVGSDLAAHFARMGSKCTEIKAPARLQIIHDFMRPGEEMMSAFDISDHMRKGHDFRDYICPDSYENHSDHFRIGDRFGRVLFLRDYASYISDDMVAEMTNLSRNLMLSIDIVPIPTDEAVKEVEQRLLGVETNITQWQRRQNMNNNFSAVIPYDLEQQRKETKEFLNDLVARDQRMMFGVLTLVHTADSKKQLDNDTDEILSIVRKKLCQMAVLRFQQLDGLMTAIPYGTRKIDAFRTLTTESLAVFMPFRVQEVYDIRGIYYGQNVISRNMIIADRSSLMNGNAFILGVPGGGKSFLTKEEIMYKVLTTDADVIVVDPEDEYSALVRAAGGSVIEISANSPNHINAMDMSSEYGETDPVAEKSQFLQTLFEQIHAGHKLDPAKQSILDRCTENVCREYRLRGYKGMPPTLVDIQADLQRQPESEAHELALELELFTRGSLNTFAKQTNVDTDNRLISYNIMELGEQLKAIGMLVILDSIMNRITRNRQKGKETYIYIDEMYLLFLHEYSSQFLYKLWKRVRKYGAFCCGITQNVNDLLQSYTARTMLSNSEFIVMLNQAASDRIELAKLLNISEEQLSYITNVEAGHGLMKIGSSLVPFENSFPKDTRLYALMTTRPSEVSEARMSGMVSDPSPAAPIGASADDDFDEDEDREAFARKIMEVARNNEGFGELVNKYLEISDDSYIHNE